MQPFKMKPVDSIFLPFLWCCVENPAVNLVVRFESMDEIANKCDYSSESYCARFLVHLQIIKRKPFQYDHFNGDF